MVEKKKVSEKEIPRVEVKEEEKSVDVEQEVVVANDVPQVGEVVEKLVVGVNSSVVQVPIVEAMEEKEVMLPIVSCL